MSSAASAYIENSLVDAGGGVLVSAEDFAAIDASTRLKSIASATNDGGAGIVLDAGSITFSTCVISIFRLSRTKR